MCSFVSDMTSKHKSKELSSLANKYTCKKNLELKVGTVCKGAISAVIQKNAFLCTAHVQHLTQSL